MVVYAEVLIVFMFFSFHHKTKKILKIPLQFNDILQTIKRILHFLNTETFAALIWQKSSTPEEHFQPE